MPASLPPSPPASLSSSRPRRCSSRSPASAAGGSGGVVAGRGGAADLPWHDGCSRRGRRRAALPRRVVDLPAGQGRAVPAAGRPGSTVATSGIWQASGRVAWRCRWRLGARSSSPRRWWRSRSRSGWWRWPRPRPARRAGTTAASRSLGAARMLPYSLVFAGVGAAAALAPGIAVDVGDPWWATLATVGTAVGVSAARGPGRICWYVRPRPRCRGSCGRSVGGARSIWNGCGDGASGRGCGARLPRGPGRVRRRQLRAAAADGGSGVVLAGSALSFYLIEPSADREHLDLRLAERGGALGRVTDDRLRAQRDGPARSGAVGVWRRVSPRSWPRTRP